MSEQVTAEELRELREQHRLYEEVYGTDKGYHGECSKCDAGVMFPCPTIRALDALAAAEKDRDEWVATAKRLSMKLGGVKQ